MIKLEDLESIQLEITSNCNAMCLDCARNIDGVKLNPYVEFGKAGNMSFELFKSILNKKTLPNFKKLELDGNFGDSLIHPQSYEFMEYYCNEFPGTGIEINSNGSYNDTDWWYKLGKLLSTHLKKRPEHIKFGIDGVDFETHGIYRRNLDYNKIIDNAKAFIDGGGVATWKFLEFDHNTHQVEQARQIAKELGFKRFYLKATRNKTRVIEETLDNKSYKVTGQATKKKEHIEIDSMDKATRNVLETHIKSIVSDTENFYDTSTVRCPWQKRKMIQIDYDGRIYQCCHIGGKYGRAKNFRHKEYQYYIDKYGIDWNNLNIHTLQEVFDHPYWKDLDESFDNSIHDKSNPRIKRCVEKCSAELWGKA